MVISQPCLGPRCKGDRHGEEFVLFHQAEASTDSYGFDSQQQQQQQRLNRHHTQKTLRVLVVDPCLGCYGAREQQTPPERAHLFHQAEEASSYYSYVIACLVSSRSLDCFVLQYFVYGVDSAAAAAAAEAEAGSQQPSYCACTEDGRRIYVNQDNKASIFDELLL